MEEDRPIGGYLDGYRISRLFRVEREGVDVLRGRSSRGVTSTHACVCERASLWTVAVRERGGFADRQILTVVNLRLPIPVAERFGDGAISVSALAGPEIRGVRLPG